MQNRLITVKALREKCPICLKLDETGHRPSGFAVCVLLELNDEQHSLKA